MLKAGLVELNWTFVFQIINTFILFTVLKKFLFVPVTKAIEERQSGIDSTLIDAERITQEAENYRNDYYKKLKSAEDEKMQIIASAQKIAEDKSDMIIMEARESALKQKEKADQDILIEKKKAYSELKEEVSSLAILAASQILQKEIDEDKNKDIVQNLIEQMGEAKWEN